MPVALATELHDGDESASLSVSGELDLASAPELRAAIGELLGAGIRHLEVDLDECSFLDSSGLGALLWGHHRLRAAGGDLVAVNVHGPAARTIELSGIEHVVAVRH